MLIKMQDMIDAGVHFGHQTKFWNPKMKPYIFGERNKIHIINLDKTVPLMLDALKFVERVTADKGSILFVGTRYQASNVIKEEAIRAGMPYINHRWLGGTLTNFKTIRNSIKKLQKKEELLNGKDDGFFVKKERLNLAREVNKLQNSIGGLVDMKGLPQAIFVIDSGYHSIAIEEARKLGIPVIAVVDTNNDPTVVDYPIPGNDDSVNSIRLITKQIVDVILATKEAKLKELVNEVKKEKAEEKEVEAKVVQVSKETKEKTTETKEEA